MGAGKPGSIKNTDQPSTISEHDPERRRVNNIQNIRSIRMICLYNTADSKSKDWQQAIADIQQAVHNNITFSDSDQCLEFIQNDDMKVCVVIFGSLGQEFISRIHDMPQVDSVFIYSDNRPRDEQLIKLWTKINGVFRDTAPICRVLKKTIQQCEQNTIPLSFLPSTIDLDQLDLPLLYTHILKEVILTSNFEENHLKEFIDYCRELFANNKEELVDVKEFESKYRTQTPIWWYTNDCFLNPMLNYALRTMNGEMITSISFFIVDLHRQIVQLHQEQYRSKPSSSAIFTVYHAQGLTKVDFEQLKKSRGGLISFNNFLLTSKNSKHSLSFAQDNGTKGDLVGVMFIMKIDPSQSSFPFASVRDVSYSHTEDGILFSMPTLFRINDIKRLTANNRVQEVSLTLISDKDKDLALLTNYIRQENTPDKQGWFQLGSLLMKMNYLDKAEQFYQFLLNQTKDTTKKAAIYSQLGQIKDIEKNYSEATTFYEKAIAIYQKTPPTDQLDLANLYFNIGLIYSKIDNTSKAISSHKEALKIREQLLPPDHIDLAKSYGNVGLLCVNSNDYSAAISYFEKELIINEKILPANHPGLAVCLMDIGMLSYNSGNYSKALSSFEKALEIRQKILPPNHPDLAELYNIIGLAYNNMSDHSKALSNHEKALEIREKALPQNHPDIGASLNNIGVTYENMENHVKARSFLVRAIENGECSLSPDDPILQMRKDNLERIKEKL
ncbi:unnamed protein product [Adineta ricciae]|uniref:Uncharacterized protein n=1 Tax=Adineta ricciae TaxID=249248 RepID=A0A815QGW1_ADIRI|nr:unnamed protein product [Adineta ricciae]CAF1463145.1 unnamed protein product [Adineta ricciae]